MDLLENKVEHAHYVRACSVVQQQIERIRDNRKRERVVEKLQDAQASENKKAKRSAQRKAAKTRKIKAQRQRTGR